MTEKQKMNEPKAIIIAAIITSVVTLIIAFFQYFFNKSDNYQCDRIRHRAESYAEKLNEKILGIKNDRELINHVFWRDKFKEISLYDCNQIDIQFEKIVQSFEKASKQLDL